MKSNQIHLDQKNRKKITVFLACLLFSVCFWLLFSLSKPYTYTVQAIVYFRNIPERMTLNLPKTAHISLSMEGSGWQLLSNHMQASLDLVADLEGRKFSKYIFLRNFLPDFNQQLPANQRIISVQPDTVFLNPARGVTKKVPLEVKYKITFQKQYYYLDPVEISQDSVVLSGSESELAGINKWESPEIRIDRLNHSVDTSINLQSQHYPLVLVKPDQIHFAVRVDQFTENVITLPIHVENKQDAGDVQVIPSRVRIYYLVPLTYFYDVRPDLFEVSIDLNEWRNQHQNKLKLNVRRNPDFVRIEKLSPISVDFLIQK